ncbi:hypothetical protein Tco_0661786 [Tanacetum coccineum]
MEVSRCYRYTLDVKRMSRDAIIVHEMFNEGVEMLLLYIRCSTDESRFYRGTLDVQRMCRDSIVVQEMFNGGAKMMSSRDAIVVHEMFNRGVEMISLYMRCSTDESRWYRYTRCSMEELRCHHYSLDVQRMSRDAIVVHEMFKG